MDQSQTQSFFEQPLYLRILPFLAVFTVYVIGLFVDVMDVDASQYASISREMLETGNYLQLFNRYQDYLDKPPLLFWLSALSFKLFGVSNFAYKFPSFLSSLLGVYATYRLGKLYYGRETGYLAALIVASCQAYFLFNHDVRTDTLLTNSVIFALWQLAEFLRYGGFLRIILGFTGIAGAMLTKGPIGLMVPVLAFTTDLALKRQWRHFFRWEWLAGLFWLGLLLLPMCIGLYGQFDLHPEKEMYGRTGTSGLRFFFWTQSFGRITGENVWKNDTGPFFFVHTFLWAFLPWSLLFIAALFRQVRRIVRQRFRISEQEEALTIGGFLLPFLVLSTSQYKLPHYIFVLFPLAAILTGKYLNQLMSGNLPKSLHTWSWVQLIVVVLLWVAGGLLAIVCFPLQNIWLWLITLLLTGLSLWLFFAAKNAFTRLFLPSLVAIAGVNLLMNSHVYPALFTYQSPSVVARYAQAAGIDKNQLYVYKVHMHSLDFYSQRIVPMLNSLDDLEARRIYWVFTNEEGLREAQQSRFRWRLVRTFDHFHISTLTLPFLNPRTRAGVVEHRYLLEIRK